MSKTKELFQIKVQDECQHSVLNHKLCRQTLNSQLCLSLNQMYTTSKNFIAPCFRNTTSTIPNGHLLLKAQNVEIWVSLKWNFYSAINLSRRRNQRMKEPEVLKLKLKIQRHSNIITLVQDGYHQDRIIKLYPRNCY